MFTDYPTHTQVLAYSSVFSWVFFCKKIYTVVYERELALFCIYSITYRLLDTKTFFKLNIDIHELLDFLKNAK